MSSHLEAAERGLAVDLAAEFPREEGVVPDALWYCDMTTGPDGQDFEVTVRLGAAASETSTSWRQMR